MNIEFRIIVKVTAKNYFPTYHPDWKLNVC